MSLMNVLLRVSDEHVIFRVLKIVINIYLMCPLLLIWVFKGHAAICRNFLGGVIFVELFYRERLSSKFADQPCIAADRVIKIHVYPRKKVRKSASNNVNASVVEE